MAIRPLAHFETRAVDNDGAGNPLSGRISLSHNVTRLGVG